MITEANQDERAVASYNLYARLKPVLKMPKCRVESLRCSVIFGTFFKRPALASMMLLPMKVFLNARHAGPNWSKC